MMVVDTSALIAILMDEPERQSFNNAMVNDVEVLVLAVIFV